jgi:hypothetical protein
MRRELRDAERMLSVIAAEAGARLVGIETTGGDHYRVRFLMAGGGVVHITIANTPSDHRSRLNARAYARRLLRDNRKQRND